MQIVDIKLTGVTRFDEFSCKFSPGLNIIAGPNGSGKTSILDSIYYGIYSQIRDRNIFLNVNSNKGKIAVRFICNGQEYLIEKEFSRSGNTKAFLYKLLEDTEKPELVVCGTNQIKEWVEDVIGSEDATKWYLSQGEIDRFAMMVFEKDAISLGRMLGLGRMDALASDFNDVLNTALPYSQSDHITVSSMYSSAITLSERIEKELDSLSAELVKLGLPTRDLSNLVALRLDLAKQHDFCKNLLSALLIQKQLTEKEQERQTLLESYNQIREAIHRLEGEIYVLCVECQSKVGFAIPELPEPESDLSKAPTFGSCLYEKLIKLPLAEARARRAQLQALQKSYFDEAHSFAFLFRSRQVPVQRKLEELTQRVAVIKSELATCTQVLPESLLECKECPTCHRPLDGVDFERIRERIVILKEDLNKLTEAWTELNSQHVARQQLRKKARELLSKLRVLRSQIHDLLRFENDGQLLLIDDLVTKTYIPKLEEFLKQYQNLLAEDLRIRTQLQSLERGIDSLKAQLAETDEVIRQVLPQSSLEAAQLALEDLRTKLAVVDLVKERKAKLDSELDLARQQIMELRASVEKYARLQDFHPYARKFVNVHFIQAAESIIREYIHSVLLPEINSLCRKLDLSFSVDSVQEDGRTAFYANTAYGKVPISRLSYGQRTMLSVITAFVFYLNSGGNGVLLADEPTAGLDSKNVQMLLSLFDTLHEFSLNKKVQCIFTSHEYGLYSGSAFNLIDLTGTVV